MTDLISLLIGIVVLGVTVWSSVKGIKWYTRWKTRRAVLAEIEQHHIDYYMQKRKEFDARTNIDTVHDAREFLRNRTSK